MQGLIRKELRSDLAWRLTGLTYPTAVLATSGSVRTVSDYLAFCRAQMEPLLQYFPSQGHCLEFGSGLGGNSLAVARSGRCVLGLDVNPFYTRIATRIARRYDVKNTDFQTYDGRAIPQIGFAPNVVFSIGVFERLPHRQVADYISTIAGLEHRGGIFISYFLSPAALDTTFVRLLGREAYKPWTREEVEQVLGACGFSIRATIPWTRFPRSRGQGDEAVARVFIAVKSEN